MVVRSAIDQLEKANSLSTSKNMDL